MNEKENETLDIDIDDLFKDPEGSQPDEEKEEKPSQPNEEMTKAVSERINTVRKKAESETEERVAKELGYDSYEAMRKANENKLLKSAGIDETDEELMAAINKIVEQRINDNPRMKKLAEIEEDEKNKFVKAQLKEINEMTGNKFTSIDELPKETLDMWGKIGNLSQAYFATQGASLLNKSRAEKSNGSLSHLANGGSGSSGTKMRPLTEEEKDIYRMVMPDISDDELSKIMKENN